MSWIYLLDIFLTSFHLLTTWKRGAGTRKWTAGKSKHRDPGNPQPLLYFHPQQGLIFHSLVRPVHSSLACSVLLPSHSTLAAEERNPVRFNAVLTGLRLHTSQTEGSLWGLLFPSLWLTVWTQTLLMRRQSPSSCWAIGPNWSITPGQKFLTGA